MVFKTNKKMFFSILPLIILIFNSSFILAQEAEPFALILNVKGEVILHHNHQLQPVEIGTLLFNGDILLTKDNSLALIKFSDNSAIIKLFSNSSLTIYLEKEAECINKMLNLDSGNLWSAVKSNIGNYSIQTPTGVAGIKGTEFLISVDSKTAYTTVAIFKGTVELGNDFGMINVTANSQGFSNGIDPPSSNSQKSNQISMEIRDEIGKTGIKIEESVPKFEKEIETTETPQIPEQKDEKLEGKKDESSPFLMVAGIGSVTMGSQTYTQIRLMPEFTIWKFGLGLDINLLIDSEGKVRKKDWENFEDYLNKILYVRFAKRNDPLYIRIGSFPKVKFGQGLIMRDYTNMLDYPEIKQLGAELAVNTKFYDLGFDIFCSNIYEHDILAGRVKGKPLKTINIPLIKNIQLGVTAVSDFNQLGALEDSDGDGYPDKFDDYPDNKNWWADTDGDGWSDPRNQNEVGGDTTGFVDLDANNDNIPDAGTSLDSLNLKKVFKLGKKEGITIFGFDYIIPLLNSKHLKIYHYGEFAKILDYGNGFIFPGFGASFFIFDLNLEYRIFGKKFLPNYFNYLYDSERAVIRGDSVVTKESQLKDINSAQGWRGELTSHILNFLDLSIAYEDIHGKDYNMGKSIHGKLTLVQRFIPKLSHAYARYSQTQVEKITTWKSPNAIIEAQLGYELSPNSVLLWNYKEYYVDYDNSGRIDKDDETIKSFSLGFRFKF